MPFKTQLLCNEATRYCGTCVDMVAILCVKVVNIPSGLIQRQEPSKRCLAIRNYQTNSQKRFAEISRFQNLSLKRESLSTNAMDAGRLIRQRHA